jgi:hypothetical protein
VPSLEEIAKLLKSTFASGNAARQAADAAAAELWKFRKEAYQSLLQLGADNYKENTRIAGVLEDKAQKTGAIAGVFLAAGLAFVKPDLTLVQLGGKLGFALLTTSIFLLLVCISLCLGVMWVRSLQPQLLVFDVSEMLRHILALPASEITNEVKENFYRDQEKVWKSVLKEQLQKIGAKSQLLQAAQGILALAMLLVAIFLFLLLLRAYRAPVLLPI